MSRTIPSPEAYLLCYPPYAEYAIMPAAGHSDPPCAVLAHPARSRSCEDRLVMGNRYLEPVLAWYGAQARDLPWRRSDASPWAVLVSEFMLQQTPVSRVLGPYAAWLERWPDAPALAASPPGEAVRQWGTLGYPRRALRLHETARILTKNYGGQVPASVAELILLPGVGVYTAAAVASFAYRQAHAVLDTNVRDRKSVV